MIFSFFIFIFNDTAISLLQKKLNNAGIQYINQFDKHMIKPGDKKNNINT